MKRAGKNGVKRVNKILITGFTLMLIVLSSISIFSSYGGAKRASNDEPEIEFLMIDSIIDNNYVTTEIHEKFKNPNDYAIDETFTFQIPEKAFISNFSLVIGNDTYFAKIVSKDVGEQKYQDAVVNGSDAGLVEAQGKNVSYP
jgi:Ca-activated chloride channel family protein